MERLIEELQHHETLAGRISVWVGYTDGRSGLGQTNLSVPTDRFDSLLEAARPCLHNAWIRGASAQRMHLIAENLHRREPRPLGLFDAPREHSQAVAVAQVKRQINDRIGRFALRSAATLPLKSIYQDSSNSYDICDVRGKTCF
jgi:hypothetical protein